MTTQNSDAVLKKVARDLDAQNVNDILATCTDDDLPSAP